MPTGSKAVSIVAFSATPVYYRTSLFTRLAADPRVSLAAVFASSEGLELQRNQDGQLIAKDSGSVGNVRTLFLENAIANPGDGSFLQLRDTDILRKLMALDPDVLLIHGYNFATHQMAVYYQKLRRRPLLFREEMTLLSPRPAWKKVAKQLGVRLMLREEYGLYIGCQNKAWFQHFGMPDNRLFFTPYSVDNDFFQGEAQRLRPQRQVLRASLGIAPDSGPVITTVCRLVAKKDTMLLLEAFKRVRQTTAATLLIVGAGPLEGMLRSRVASEHIPDVIFAGHLPQSEVSKAYVSSDIFVLPSSHDETWGLVVNEAMNFELPIVVSDQVGSGYDLVETGMNGLVFPARNADALTECLMTLVQSKETREVFGAASLKRIQHWNHDIAAQGVLSAIESAVGPERWRLASF